MVPISEYRSLEENRGPAVDFQARTNGRVLVFHTPTMYDIS